MLPSLKRFVRAEEGASMVEYGLLLALIALVCMTALGMLGGNVKSLFSLDSTAAASNP